MLVTSTAVKSTARGKQALAHLQESDAKRKSFNGSASDVEPGKIEFTDEIAVVGYVDSRTGEDREYDAIICKDSKGAKHAIAISALKEKDPIVGDDGKLYPAKNLFEFDVPSADVYNAIKGKSCTMIRVKGKRNNWRGRYEIFVDLN